MEVLVVLIAFGIIFGIPIALVILVVVLRGQAVKKRQQAMSALAAGNGWTWVPQDSSWAHRWTGEPFEVGDGRTATNILLGRHQGWDFAAFDYHYTISNGKTSTQVTCAVWALKLPSMLPWLTVERQGVFGKNDVQTESEQFNQAYKIHGHDDRYAMAVLHPRMMELLMSAPETYWRIDRDSLVYWEPGPIEPQRYVQRLNLLVTIAGLIPSYVWKDYGR
ncbi:DUF3137 domain-containing protein [Flindersiella endophytica]